MKTIIRLLIAFTVVSFFSISCNKENNSLVSNNKNQFADGDIKHAYASTNYGLINRFAEIERKLNFTTSQQMPNFVQQPPTLNFTGGTGTSGPDGPDVPGGCLVSTMGAPNQGHGWIFNYHADGRISYINEYEYGDEILISFTYNSKGQVIETDYYDVDGGIPELELSHVFQYNSQGLVTQVQEFYSSGSYALFYFNHNNLGQITKIYGDFYDAEFIYQYSNGNVTKETVNVTYSGTVYTEISTFSYDNMNNFWKPLNIPQPFFDLFAWMESKNNMIKWTTTDIDGETDVANFWYDYNAERYPSYMYSDEYGLGPIEYFNCGK